MRTIYCRQDHRPADGEVGKVFYPRAADRVRIGERVAIVDTIQFGGTCVAMGTVEDVFENGYSIRVSLLHYRRNAPRMTDKTRKAVLT